MSRLFSQNTSELLPGVVVNGGLPFGFTMDTGWASWGNFIHRLSFKDDIVWTRRTRALKVGAYVQGIRAGPHWGMVDT